VNDVIYVVVSLALFATFVAAVFGLEKV